MNDLLDELESLADSLRGELDPPAYTDLADKIDALLKQMTGAWDSAEQAALDMESERDEVTSERDYALDALRYTRDYLESNHASEAVLALPVVDRAREAYRLALDTIADALPAGT